MILTILLKLAMVVFRRPARDFRRNAAVSHFNTTEHQLFLRIHPHKIVCCRRTMASVETADDAEELMLRC